MGSVERINFAVPPPGYFREPGTEFVRQGHGKRRTMAEAWTRWKERRDPPGLVLRHGPHGLGFIALGKNSPIYGAHDWEPEARAAAWNWCLATRWT